MADAARLFEAIEQGDPVAVVSLIAADRDLLNAAGPNGESVLLNALYHNRHSVVEVLLAGGAPVGLHEAAALGDRAAVAQFLAAAPDSIDSFTPDGYTALHLATWFGQQPVAQLLLSEHADPNIRSRNRYNAGPLHTAVAARRFEIAAALLAFNADPNQRQADDWTPLHAAAHDGHLAMIELLIAGGADLEPVNAQGATPLGLAEAQGHGDAADFLRRYGATR